MGTPVPDDWPEIEADKWYRIKVDLFWDMSEDQDCSQDYIGQQECCQLGAIISYFIENTTCINYAGICNPLTLAAQRIICVTGPFDSQEDCWAYEG